MKNVLTTLTALLAVLTAVSLFSACSPDIVEEEEATEETPLTPEPILELGPNWIDGTITISVGNFQSGEAMLQKLQEKGVEYGLNTKRDLVDPNFPISGKQYNVKISIVTMYEVGKNEPTSYEDTYNRYLERGYRPLTPEEAVELRLQFLNQPIVGTGERLANFFALMDPAVIASYGHESAYYNIGRPGRNYRRLWATSPERILDPAKGFSAKWLPEPAPPEVRFAVVKE